MTGRERTRAVLAGAAAGIAGGLFGVGGGIVLVPMLTALFRQTQHQAHGTSLVVVGATALASLVVYGAHGNVAWGTAGTVGIVSMFTARYGARWASRTSPNALRRAFAVLVLAVAVRLFWKSPAASGSALHGLAPEIAFNVLLGAAIGLLSGFMGVGGGLIAVPAFALVLGLPQPLAQGTSLGVILVTAPAGAIEHNRNGNVTLRLAAWMSLGAAAGGPAASWLAQRLPREMLVRAFAVFLLANAFYFWFRAGARGSGPRKPAGANGRQPPRQPRADRLH